MKSIFNAEAQRKEKRAAVSHSDEPHCYLTERIKTCKHLTRESYFLTRTN
jgi:hypothetical protein